MVVAVVTVVSRFLLPQDEQALLRGDAPAALGYVANWRMILRGTDYFTQTASPSLLQHTWSLDRGAVLSVVVGGGARPAAMDARAPATDALFAVVGGGVIASAASGHFSYAVNGVRVPSDGVRFTAAGVRWLAPWLVPQLVTAAREVEPSRALYVAAVGASTWSGPCGRRRLHDCGSSGPTENGAAVIEDL